jgi:hypothetical protein
MKTFSTGMQITCRRPEGSSMGDSKQQTASQKGLHNLYLVYHIQKCSPACKKNQP